MRGAGPSSRVAPLAQRLAGAAAARSARPLEVLEAVETVLGWLPTVEDGAQALPELCTLIELAEAVASMGFGPVRLAGSGSAGVGVDG